MNSENLHALKPYQISFEQRTGYLYAHVSAERDSFEISKSYLQEIADECLRTKIKRVLIEEEIPETISFSEMYRLATELPGMGFYEIRTAFVDHYLEQQELNRFGELVAVNRGFRGKVFDNVAEAEKWLLAE